MSYLQGESTDNFNWGVRRRPLSEGETEGETSLRQMDESLSEKTPVLSKRNRVRCSNQYFIQYFPHSAGF